MTGVGASAAAEPASQRIARDMGTSRRRSVRDPRRRRPRQADTAHYDTARSDRVAPKVYEDGQRREGAELAGIRVAHVGKALLPLLERALQRVPEHEVDVVSDEHEGGRAEGGADSAGGVGEDEGADAEPGEHAHRQRCHLGRVALIEMKAPALDQYV